MQLLCIPSTVDHSVYLEQIHLSLPSLTATFEAWPRSGWRGAMDTLNLREQRLGVATLSGASLRLLYEKEVSFSLSLFESLVLPLSCFRAILRQYAERAYTPNVRWIELPSKEWNAA